MPDPERIWLEPGDGAPDTGRLWCRDDVWDEPATEYVRADIHAARVAELEAALREVQAWWDDPWTTGADGDPELKEEQLDAILARALDGAGNG